MIVAFPGHIPNTKVTKHWLPKYKSADFFLVDSLRPSQQSFSYVGRGLPGLNQY